MRLDRYLRQRFIQVPLSRIHASIRQGEVRINHKRVQANTRLQEHDQLRVPPMMQLPPKNFCPTSTGEKTTEKPV